MTNTNNWDGKITREMFDLSEVGTDFETFKSSTRKYLVNCLVGNAHLTGEGSLLDYFDEIIEEVVERGEIALIELADNKYLATVKKLKQSVLKEKVAGEKEGEETIEPQIEYEFTLLDNSNIKRTTEDVDKYVIFKFNKAGDSPLTGLSFWTKRLSNILKQMEKEMFMNEKGIMVTVPSWPQGDDIDLIVKSFSKKPFFFMCLPKSQKGDTKTGTAGIPPHSIKTEIYEPKSFNEEQYRNLFSFTWNNMERAYGIRHDTLQEKEERASITEVFSSQANFQAQEKKIYRLLWKSIQEYNRVFDNNQANYQFSYGIISNKSASK